MSDPLAAHDVFVLDGGTATELQRAGMSVRAPWWTTRALLTDENRRMLRVVHEQYIGAGAHMITANTFRANLRALGQTRLDGAGREWMVHAAVGVAGAARSGRPEVLVAGSIGPVEDCYRPDLVPSDDMLHHEHEWLAQQLLRSGSDVIMIETMNTVREARIAWERASEAGARTWVSFACVEDARLLSGERLVDAARAVEDAEVVLVNCTSPEDTAVCLRALRTVRSGLIGACPNLEDRNGLALGEHVDRYLPTALAPEQLAEFVTSWRDDYDVRVIGGCCGTTPAHVAALASLAGKASA